VTNSDHPVVRRGEIYWLDWNPARGSKQAGRRPALIIQENPASSNPNYPLTIVVAVSTRGRNIPSHVAIQPSAQNGLSAPSFIKCEQIQTVSKDRLVQQVGVLDTADMEQVEVALKKVLALP
jgi:mRNA interferase MazF